jgi:hypothetical protein
VSRFVLNAKDWNIALCAIQTFVKNTIEWWTANLASCVIVVPVDMIGRDAACVEYHVLRIVFATRTKSYRPRNELSSLESNG